MASGDGRSRLATLVEKRLLELAPRKSQREIAHEAGYPNPNMLSMIKSGVSKVSIERVPALAKALELDPVFLMNIVLQDHFPKVYEAFTDVFGFGRHLTEFDVVAVRSARAGLDKISPYALTPEIAQELQDAIGDAVSKVMAKHAPSVKEIEPEPAEVVLAQAATEAPAGASPLPADKPVKLNFGSRTTRTQAYHPDGKPKARKGRRPLKGAVSFAEWKEDVADEAGKSKK